MNEDAPVLILALATQNAALRQQLASAQDLLVETAIDAGQLHARIEVLQAERDALKIQSGGLNERSLRNPIGPAHRNKRLSLMSRIRYIAVRRETKPPDLG